jgi:hypothetical protein
VDASSEPDPEQAHAWRQRGALLIAMGLRDIHVLRTVLVEMRGDVDP